jgi:pantoate--beta-alanine ligase
MVRDLNLPVEIVVVPIVREPDGLAMSSRNAYLGPQERKSALVLYRALSEVKKRFDQGERNTEKLMEAGKQVLSQEPRARLDYLETVDPDTLDPISEIRSETLVAVAAFVGGTRLLDNILLSPK